MKRILTALFLLPLAAHAQDKGNHSYFCKTEVAGGLHYNETVKKWTSTSFKPQEDFVLRLKYVETKVEKIWQYASKEEPVTYYSVTLTPKGTTSPYNCFAHDTTNGQVRVTPTTMIVCNSNLTDYKFNLGGGRFLSAYLFGYVDGLDKNDNTPGVAGGTCTKIE